MIPVNIVRNKREVVRDRQLSHSKRPREVSHESEFLSQTYQAALAQLKAKHEQLEHYQNQLDARTQTVEAFNQHVIGGLPIGLIAVDPAGSIKIMNEPAKKIFGLTGDAPGNIFLDEVFAESPVLSENLRLVTNGKIGFKQFELTLEKQFEKQLEKKLLEVSLAPLTIRDQIGGALCLISDVTEVARLREQSAVQRNLESLGIMSAGLAHEFKNSLATVSSYAQFLERSAAEEKIQRAAASLNSEVRKFSEMITAFLNFAKPQALTMSEVKLEEILSDCAQELKTLFANQPIAIKIKGIFPRVAGDGSVLRQAFLNLMRNAVEANLEAETACIVSVNGTLEVDENSCSWSVIEIYDRGRGFANEDLQFIFVPFFTTKKHGHGIGLALTHRIITLHQGTLTARNHDQSGAVLTIRLKTI